MSLPRPSPRSTFDRRGSKTGVVAVRQVLLRVSADRRLRSAMAATALRVRPMRTGGRKSGLRRAGWRQEILAI